MNQSGFKTAEVIDLEALTNSQAASEDVIGSAVSDQVGKPASRPPSALGTGNGETVSDISSSSDPHATLAQSHVVVSSLTPLDLTRPVKTEGEASPSMSTVSQPPPTDGASILPASQTQATSLSGPQGASGDASGDPSSTPSPSLPVSVASLGTFGSPLTALGSQLNLTAEEQSAAYRKANILALSALAKKGGPNAREMLAVQGKLQEFLTHLITLAGNSGQQLKSTVQMLVQQLVTGSISEQEFAMRIEKDLHSQHQPSLLPFLQNSVPHLRTRLQLQQAIMRELLQRQAQEKLQRKSQDQKTPQATSLTAPAAPATTVTATATGGAGASNSLHGVSNSQPVPAVDIIGPASANVSLPPLNQHSKLNNITASLAQSTSIPSPSPSSSSPSPAPAATSAAGSASSPASSIPLPISTTSLTAHLREQLAKFSPQQRVLYMQQLTAHSKQTKQQQPQQRVVAAVTASPASTGKTTAGNSVSAPTTAAHSRTLPPPPAAAGGKVTAQPHPSINVQQIIGGEHQVSVGGVAVKQISPSQLPLSSSNNHLGASGPGRTTVMAASLSPSRGGQIRAGFVDVKLASSVSKSASPPSGKGKGRVKAESGKNAADDDEEEDDEMDFAGVKTVNLQAESMLPTNLGETMRTVRDEAFFDLRLLKHKALSIAHRYGLSDVNDEFLVLLSHGIQERLKDILEKVTVVSQHRTESLKDESVYEVSSEVKGQLKVLESIDRMSHRRKQEREKDKILKAARSRSRAEDPEAAAKIKEQAKKLQQEEAQKIRDRRANEAALAALTAISGGTKRKRPSPAEGASGSGVSTQDTGSGHTSLLGTQTGRQPKRRVTARDLLFYLEQTKETRKSLVLYKSLVK